MHSMPRKGSPKKVKNPKQCCQSTVCNTLLVDLDNADGHRLCVVCLDDIHFASSFKRQLLFFQCELL